MMKPTFESLLNEATKTWFFDYSEKEAFSQYIEKVILIESKVFPEIPPSQSEKIRETLWKNFGECFPEIKKSIIEDCNQEWERLINMVKIPEKIRGKHSEEKYSALLRSFGRNIQEIYFEIIRAKYPNIPNFLIQKQLFLEEVYLMTEPADFLNIIEKDKMLFKYEILGVDCSNLPALLLKILYFSRRKFTESSHELWIKRLQKIGNCFGIEIMDLTRDFSNFKERKMRKEALINLIHILILDYIQKVDQENIEYFSKCCFLFFSGNYKIEKGQFEIVRSQNWPEIRDGILRLLKLLYNEMKALKKNEYVIGNFNFAKYQLFEKELEEFLSKLYKDHPKEMILFDYDVAMVKYQMEVDSKDFAIQPSVVLPEDKFKKFIEYMEVIDLTPTRKSPYAVITLSGFTSEKDDFSQTWNEIKHIYPYAKIFSIRYKAGTSLDLISLFIKRNYLKAEDHAKEVGKRLAALIMTRSFGYKALTLVGFSLGTKIVLWCLKYLEILENNYAKVKGDHLFIQDVILMGGAGSVKIKKYKEKWIKRFEIVQGRIINFYQSESDNILEYVLYWAKSGSTYAGVIGKKPIPLATSAKSVFMANVNRIKNINLEGKINGHFQYMPNLSKIYKMIDN